MHSFVFLLTWRTRSGLANLRRKMKFLCHKVDENFASTFSKLKIVNKKQEEKERSRGGGWAGDNEVKISCVSLLFFFSFEGGRVVVKWQMYKGFRFEPGGYFGPNKLLVMRLL